MTRLVGTPSSRRPLNISTDWAGGHSMSRSPTQMKVGVLAFLMASMGDSFR